MAEKLIDLKRPAPDRKAGADCMPCCGDQQYPYGLNIRLESQELAKLGITQMPAVGSELKGQFVGVVTACSQGMNEHDESCMSVQIVQMSASIEAEPAGTQDNETKEPRGAYKPAIVE